MLINLHSQATTTPKIRAAIQASDEPVSVLAERFGVTEQTVYKWRKRDSVEDRSHTPHRLQTTLTPAQEAVAVALRTTLLVALDDLLAVVREFLNPDVSRSGLDLCPLRIRTILTDNGKEFTDRLFGLRKRGATGEHEFDKLCADLEIEHRLTPPQSPQTNGTPLGDCRQSPAEQWVERFNGRIEEVLQSHHFRSGEDLEATLHRYVWLYNQQLPQSALGSKTPLHAMKDWHKLKPELFKKQPYYLTGCDSTWLSSSRKVISSTRCNRLSIRLCTALSVRGAQRAASPRRQQAPFSVNRIVQPAIQTPRGAGDGIRREVNLDHRPVQP